MEQTHTLPNIIEKSLEVWGWNLETRVSNWH